MVVGKLGRFSHLEWEATIPYNFCLRLGYSNIYIEKGFRLP